MVGQTTFYGGKIFSGHHQKDLEEHPRMPPRGYGPQNSTVGSSSISLSQEHTRLVVQTLKQMMEWWNQIPQIPAAQAVKLLKIDIDIRLN